MLALSAAAKLAGAQGPTAIAEFAARLTQRQLAAVRAFRSPTTGRLAAPSKSCVHRVLSELDPDALDDAARRFAAAGRPAGGALAVDGKSVPLNRPGGPDPDRMFVAAVEHGSGVVRGQVASDSAGGEIEGARRLLREIGVADRVATLDALHGCPNTARLVVDGGGDHVVPIKDNHPTLLDDIRILDWDGAPSRRAVDKGHGRLEERVCAVAPLDGAPDDVAALPGRRQAFRIVRRRTVLKSGKTSEETVHGLTSLPPERAGASEILALNRGHWEIENRVHYVRDFSFDEDRSRIRAGKLPRNLACLSNTAISIVRMRGRFQHQPQAHRHYAARQADAVREVLAPVFRPDPAETTAARAGPPRARLAACRGNLAASRGKQGPGDSENRSPVGLQAIESPSRQPARAEQTVKR